jgi:translation initiation factor 5A
MDVPVVKRTELQVVDISDDDFLTLMTEDGSETRSDLKVPEGELGEDIRTRFGK